MTGNLHLQTIIPNASAKQVYEAWMDSKKHSAFTGDSAFIEPGINGKFAIAIGYISGTTLELEPYRRILQAWRTTEFPDDAPDSRLTILLEDKPEGCSLVLDQVDLPEDQVDSYKSGWMEYYFQPLIQYFSE